MRRTIKQVVNGHFLGQSRRTLKIIQGFKAVSRGSYIAAGSGDLSTSHTYAACTLGMSVLGRSVSNSPTLAGPVRTSAEDGIGQCISALH